MKLFFVWHPATESYRLPIPKHRNLLTLRSGPGTRNGVHIRTPAKFGVGRSKLGVPGHIYPEIKGQWLNWIFVLTFEVAKLDFF